MAHAVLIQRAALAANESPTFEAAAASVVHQVCSLTGWMAGHVWIAEPDGDTLRASGVWSATMPERLLALRDRIDGIRTVGGASVPGLAQASRRAAWSHDIASHSYVDGMAEAGIRLAAAFPVLVRQDVVAVLEFFSDRPNPPDESLTDAMAGVCAQLGRVIERSRAATALLESEERYRTLADSTPVLIWRSGEDTGCTFFNSTWLDFTGRTMTEEVGHGWTAGVHPDDLDERLTIHRSALERHEPFEMEYRLRRADGEYRWILDRGRPIRHGSRFGGYVGGCVDVSDKRQAEMEVRDREARFRALVQNADVMIIVLDAGANVREEYIGTLDLGYPEGSATGRFGMEYIHPDDLAWVATEFVEVLTRPGPSKRFLFRVRHADGSWRSVECVANNLIEDPMVNGILITVADVSARLQAEASEQEVSAHLREAQALAHMGSWWSDIPFEGRAFWSAETYRILGLDEETAPTLSRVIEAVHPDDRDRVSESATRLAAGEDTHTEFRIIRPSGEERLISSRSSVTRDDAGTIDRAFGTLYDITEAEQATELPTPRQLADGAPVSRLCTIERASGEPSGRSATIDSSTPR